MVLMKRNIIRTLAKKWEDNEKMAKKRKKNKREEKKWKVHMSLS